MDWFDLDQLLSIADISVVSQRLGIDIQRSGSEYIALCPFHADNKPSLRMFPANGASQSHFHCFACNAHGDAIALVKQVKGVDFEAAVQWLASSFGIKPERRSKKFKTKGMLPAKHGFEYSEEVFSRFHNAEDFAAWSVSRGYAPEFLYGFGFRLVRGNCLVAALKEMSLNEALPLVDELEELGLLRRMRKPIASQKGVYFLPLEEQLVDTFNDGRVVFPIRDLGGKIVGYTGRKIDEGVYDGDQTPKYLNSKGFQKSKYLFNANDAKKKLIASGKNQLIHDLYVVEGFMDAVRLSSLGFSAVALMGTSIGVDQFRILQDFASETLPRGQELTINLFLDQDTAGQRASSRAVKQLLSITTASNAWIAFDLQSARTAGLSPGKDPDECLRTITTKVARLALKSLTQPVVAALIQDELGSGSIGDLSDSVWESISPYRRDRAIFATSRLLRNWLSSVSSWDQRILSGLSTSTTPLWLNELLSALRSPTTARSKKVVSQIFLNSEVARRNHARVLAYHGSRRGELPCDEPNWQCIEVAASVFDALLVDRLNSQRFIQSTAWDAVHLPRKLTSDEKVLEDPRLKVMPHPADLVFQQYLLNELLTERHDFEIVGDNSFSGCIPAVRYYRSLGRTAVTGISHSATTDDLVLSFAYQIDMEVLEGLRPPSDQGMFRPFGECWRDFMGSLNRQIRQFDRAHVLRLDVKRYYDNVRRYVVRDRLQASLDAAFASGWPDSLRRFDAGGGDASKLVEVLCNCLFNFQYRDPDTGRVEDSPMIRGIPQGPVLSAWIGTIALFPVDEIASALIKHYEVVDDDGKRSSRIGYARYVDDIVLVADSAELLHELRVAVQHAASQLELTLLQKGDQIPPGDPDKVIQTLNDGRTFVASTPTWEPPLTGDGEWGWALGDDDGESSRQSALRILRHPQLLERPDSVLESVKQALRALDLRAADLGKCARWIWWRIATSNLPLHNTECDSSDIWSRYWADWSAVTEKLEWAKAYREFGYSDLIALEGLDRLLDVDPWMEMGLRSEQITNNREGLRVLATRVIQTDFFAKMQSITNHAHFQRRRQLVRWKAQGRLDSQHLPDSEQADFAEPRTLPEMFCLATALLMNYSLQAVGENHQTNALEPLRRIRLDSRSRPEDLTVAHTVWLILNGETTSNIDAQILSKARSLALGFIVAATPRGSLWQILNCYPALLDTQNYLCIIPPLPGIDSPHLLGYFPSANEDGDLNTLIAFGTNRLDSPARVFWGSAYGESTSLLVLEPDWSAGDSVHDELIRWNANSALRFRIEMNAAKLTGQESVTHFAARMFKLLFEIYRQHKLVDTTGEYELVPVQAHLAIQETRHSRSWYLLAEPMKSADLGGIAWIQDGGTSLRSVSIPTGDAHIWRIGCTISDILGLANDVLKHADGSSIDVDSVEDLVFIEDYVLRQQLRKLRGDLIGRADVRHLAPDGLPLAVGRALAILEGFPPVKAGPIARVFALLETEAETQAMAMRLGGSYGSSVDAISQEQGLRSRLHELLINVLRKLPLSVMEVLPVTIKPGVRMRGDLAVIHAVASVIIENKDWAARSHIHDSVAALRIGSALGVAMTGLRGLVASLIGLKSRPLTEEYWLPDDWPSLEGELVDAQSSFHKVCMAIQQDKWSDLSHLSAWCWLLMATTLLKEHLDDLNRFGKARALLRSIYVILKEWEEASSSGLVDDNRWTWPYEDLPVSSMSEGLISLVDLVPKAIELFDGALGFEVRKVSSRRYGFNRNDGSFTDSNLRTWRMRFGQYTELPSGIRSVERAETEKGEVLLSWTEVRNLHLDGQLLSVHTVEDKLAKLARVGEVVVQLEQVVHQEVEVEVSEDAKAKKALGDAEEGNSEIGEAPPNAIGVGLSQSVFNWRNAQKNSWSGRAKEPENFRVALFQWRIDETYSHPLIEAGINGLPTSKSSKKDIAQQLEKLSTNHNLVKAFHACDRGGEHQWVEAADLFSWPEHRRRRLLAEALQACKSLNVDMLVLPEYSVRADTVEWLKTEVLKDVPGLAVLAGTYRDAESLASPLTLLWMPPIDVQKSLLPDKLVPLQKALTFSRDKKYRAVAANEFFKPPVVDLKPLFNSSDFIDQFLAQFPEASDKLTPKIAASFVAEQLPALRYCIELICSELFMLSSPANFHPLARDLKALCRRFYPDDQSVVDILKDDIANLSEYLDIGHSHSHPRRSVLLVPSATSRTSDYWIAGQACVLASATATVFCNAVSGKEFVGGSCFIGNESSTNDKELAGMIARITPYHGWSKGIYYGKQSDPLGTADQALVIADLNPVHVVTGKPRPQLQRHPMQLVAYLPIVETIDAEVTEQSILDFLSDQMGSTLSDQLIEKPLRVDKTLQLKKADVFEKALDELGKSITDSKPLASSIEKFSELFSDAGAIKERLGCWERDRFQQPVRHGANGKFPPSFLDVIHVDLSLPAGRWSTVRVAAWSSKTGIGNPSELVAGGEADDLKEESKDSDGNE